MSVYVWSAFLAGTRFRAKIAPWVARFGRDPPSHHGVRARGLVAEIGAPEAAQCPPGTTFPAWPFLGPAASFAAGSSARRLVERNGARQRRAAQPSAAPPRGRCSANSSKSASVSSLITNLPSTGGQGHMLRGGSEQRVGTSSVYKEDCSDANSLPSPWQNNAAHVEACLHGTRLHCCPWSSWQLALPATRGGTDSHRAQAARRARYVLRRPLHNTRPAKR